MGDTKDSVLVVVSRGFDDENKFLAYVAPKGKAFACKLRFVGGRLKSGEDYKFTLMRELREEYGVDIYDVELLHRKKNVLGGELFLCSGKIKGRLSRRESDVGEPLWKNAKELFESDLVPNCKIALCYYLLRYHEDKFRGLIPLIREDREFMDFLQIESEELYCEINFF